MKVGSADSDADAGPHPDPLPHSAIPLEVGEGALSPDAASNGDRIATREKTFRNANSSGSILCDYRHLEDILRDHLNRRTSRSNVLRAILSTVFAVGIAAPLRAADTAAPDTAAPAPDAAAAPVVDDLKPGEVLNQTNWQKAQGLLPPEILKHYQTGEYANPIADWPSSKFDWPPDFREGSEKNQQLDLNDVGTIIEVGTGKQPAYVIGFPFPIIDPADKKAGAKILWNFFYRTWYFGTLHAESQLNWVGAKTLERRSDVLVDFQYFDGVPQAERPANPENLSARFLTVTVSPADLNGTAALSWRSRDPSKRDLNWAFVPALRRVRSVSPANRSDGFLGSDMSQDDGPFFDGKPEDFTWTLKGEVEQLRLVDPLSLKGQADQVWLPTGGWRGNWPDIPFIGYMDPKWKGAGWAPISGALAKRRFYVVEGVPKDRYYLYGRMEAYVDKATFQGAWNRKFNWSGELLNTYQVMAYLPKAFTRPDGKVDYNQSSNMAFQCAENIKRSQATIAGIKSNPKGGFDARVTYGQTHFDVTSLQHFGK